MALAAATNEQRFAALGTPMPAPPLRGGVYAPCVRVSNLLYISGCAPLVPGRLLAADGITGEGFIRGQVGRDLSTADGALAARQCGLAVLSILRAELGSLNHVRRLVKTTGMVWAVPEFPEQPEVINGFSLLMLEVFGERNGVGARSAVGFGSLPRNIPVEVDAVFEVEEGAPSASLGLPPPPPQAKL